MSYELRDLDVKDGKQAEKLAAMFNDWDSAWPGGFTRGVASTAVQVQENESRAHHLAVLVVAHEDEFVGYCNLEAAPGQTEVAYIGLLGAREKAHGKGVGKMLLREMVRRVTQMGFKQVTLHTWGGNTKAVPLYKKTGFFWVPETDVFMKNFLPTALNMPLVQNFLDGRDWYECLEREIVVAPDDVKWRGMKVFPYTFRNGDKTITLIFDAAGECLTSVETPDYALNCVLPVEDAPAGQTYKLTWELTSKTGRPLTAVLLAEAESGLSLSVQETVTVQETTHVTHDLHIPPNTAPKRGRLPAYKIKTTFLIEGQPVVLETGVKVSRPVEIETSGQQLMPGRTEQIVVRLRNRLERNLQGTLTLNAHPAIQCSAPTQTFTLPAKSWTQCTFGVTANRAGVAHALLVCETENMSLERPIAFRALDVNAVLGSIDAQDETGVLESLDTRIGVHLRGGSMNIEQAGTSRHLMHLVMGELGPPFAHHFLLPPLYEARIEQGHGGDTLIVSGNSASLPGLRIERAVTLLGGGVVRADYRVYNTTGSAIPAQLRLMNWPQLGGHLTVPLKGGLIREALQGLHEYPMGEYDVLAQGTALAENWIACEEDGLVCGLVFEGEPKQDMQWTRLVHFTYDLGAIPPHGVQIVPVIYAIAGNGTWQTVREWWKRLVQPSGIVEAEPPQPERVLKVEMTPTLLTANDQTVQVTVTNRREARLTGTLQLSGNVRVEPSLLALEGVNREQPLTAQVTVTSEEMPCARLLTAHIDTVPVPQSRKIGVVRLGTGEEVRVTHGENGLIGVDNGHLRFRVVPAYLGAMIALEQGGINHLFTCYPTPQPFLWANPWYGGLHPFIGWMGDTRLTRETFTGEPIVRTGEKGIAWHGARVTCQPVHKDLNWLYLEVEYLTCGGSNVAALVTRWTNRSGARMQTPGDGGMGAWLQVGGSGEHAVVHAEINGERQTRKRGGFGMDNYAGKWKAVENTQSGQTLLMLATGAKGKTGLDDFGKDGAHLAVQSAIDLQPNETKERLAWLVLSPDATEIDAYAAALTEHSRLP